jgi:ATP synthase protein I
MQAHDARILRGAAIPTAVVAGVVAFVAALASGMDGLVGGLVGGAVVIVFFVAGWVALARFGRDNPMLLLPIALGTYLVQLVVVGLFIVLVKDVSALDIKALAWAVIACTITWMIFQLRAFSREKMLYVEPRQEG